MKESVWSFALVGLMFILGLSFGFGLGDQWEETKEAEYHAAFDALEATIDAQIVEGDALRAEIESLKLKVPAEAEYVDESRVPHFETTEQLGDAFPHIIVDGEKLDYLRDKKWFHYASDHGQRSLWIEFQSREGGMPSRLLLEPHRKNKETGKAEVFADGRWVEAGPEADEMINSLPPLDPRVAEPRPPEVPTEEPVSL